MVAPCPRRRRVPTLLPARVARRRGGQPVVPVLAWRHRQVEESFRGQAVVLDAEVCEEAGSRANLVPLYSESSQSRSFLRSRGIFDLLPSVEKPVASEDDEWNWLIACGQLIHHPQTYEQMAAATANGRPELLQQILERLAPDAWRPHDPVAAHAKFMADMGPGFLEHIAAFNADMEALQDDEPDGTSPALPAPRLMKTARDAEERAAEMMAAVGFTAVAVTPVGPDSGVDVNSAQAVAQVKMEGVPTGRPALQRLAGAAWGHGKVGLFFSLAGYTAQALEWAELSDIACFEFA